jgi:hypothetical protein
MKKGVLVRNFLLSLMCTLVLSMNVLCADKKEPAELIAKCELITPIDENLRIIVQYFNQGKNEVTMWLPDSEKEKLVFRAIDVKVDGKDAVHAIKSPNPNLDDFAQTKHVRLKPQESSRTEISLNKLYKLPKEWKKIEIKPIEISGMAPIVACTLIIERSTKESK